VNGPDGTGPVRSQNWSAGGAALGMLVTGFARNVTHRRYTQSLHALTVAAMGKRRAKPDVRERFGTAVKFRREELGLTQEDLAEKAGIHRTYLSDIERGTRNLSLINIEKLAAALSVSMAKLFEAVDSQ
jgi:ribosome-binding protein aMBF1 (putative translation factor)